MTEPDFGACDEVRFLLPDIRLDRRLHTARTELPSVLLIWETQQIWSSETVQVRFHHARTDDKACQDVRLRPSDAAPRFAGGILEHVRGRE